MNDKDENSYEDKILDCLMRNNYGLTVVGISKLIGASRNTVYRYLGILETKTLVFRKEIGRYNLYFSKEGRQITIDVVAGFYKGLLIALNKELPIEPEQFKNIGKFISNYVSLPFEKDDIDQVTEKAKKRLGRLGRFAKKGLERGAELASQGIEAAKETIDERRGTSDNYETTSGQEGEIKFCPYCAKAVEGSGKFCNHCGENLE